MTLTLCRILLVADLWYQSIPILFQYKPLCAGVSSWGLECARNNFSGVYTDIRAYRDWIVDEIGGEPKWVLV